MDRSDSTRPADLLKELVEVKRRTKFLMCWNLFLATVIVILCLSSGMRANGDQPTRFRTPFSVVNEAGKMVFSVTSGQGGTELHLLDPGSSSSVDVRAEWRGADVHLRNAAGNTLVTIAGRKTYSELSLYDGRQKPGMHILAATNPDGSESLRKVALLDREGRNSAVLLASDNEARDIRAHDRTGALLFRSGTASPVRNFLDKPLE